jgi:hypothetical protein
MDSIMPLAMPPGFPEEPFMNFGRLASASFSPPLSHEALFDPLQRRTQFEQAWQAVRHRYRLCAECNDEFKTLIGNASEIWRQSSMADEEQNYRVERCIYTFFVGALSVFESLGFCLYFVGNALMPARFPHVDNPRQISLATTRKAFGAAFPHAAVTRQFADLSRDTAFTDVEGVRNILAHRLSGRRTIHTWGTMHSDGTETSAREETWHLPGLNKKLIFDDDLIRRQFDDVTHLLTGLVTASLAFVQTHGPGGAPA